MKIKKGFIRLCILDETGDNFRWVWVNVDSISEVEADEMPDEDDPDFAMVTFGGKQYFTEHTVEEVMAAIERAKQ